jgi:hypothetical protein
MQLFYDSAETGVASSFRLMSIKTTFGNGRSIRGAQSAGQPGLDSWRKKSFSLRHVARRV